MALFSFIFFKSYNYIFAFWVLDIITSLIDEKRKDKLKFSNIKVLITRDYMTLLYLNISDLLSVILVLITHFKSKSEKEKDEKTETKNNNKYELIYTDLSIKKHKFILILLFSIVDFIGRCSFIFYRLITRNEDELKTRETFWIISIDIILRIIFSKLILKTKLYNHHFVSLILFIIGFLPMIIKGNINMTNSEYKIFILFEILRDIFFGFGDTISKILLTIKFLLPQHLMLWKGIACFGIHLILFPIFYFCNIMKFSRNGENYFSNYDSILILLEILYIIISLVKGIIILKIIDIFSPQHVCFVNVIIHLFNYCKFFAKEYDSCNKEFFYICLIAFIIVILGTLIFNEIIILNFCNLNKYTRAGILEREKKEIQLCDSRFFTKEDEEEEEISKNSISIN